MSMSICYQYFWCFKAKNRTVGCVIRTACLVTNHSIIFKYEWFDSRAVSIETSFSIIKQNIIWRIANAINYIFFKSYRSCRFPMWNKRTFLNLGRIACFVSGALGILALASLVTAIIINAKSLTYVSTHFTNNLISYGNSPNARGRIDLLQYKYQCCGTNIWLDWQLAGLNATSPMMNVTSATTASLITTVNSVVNTTLITTSTTGSTVSITSTTTTIGSTVGITLTTTTVSIISITSTTSTTTLPIQNITANQTLGKNVKRDMTHISADTHHRRLRKLADYSRKKRQITLTYGDIEGLPLSFSVTLPRSCCITGALLTSTASDACKYHYVLHQ